MHRPGESAAISSGPLLSGTATWVHSLPFFNATGSHLGPVPVRPGAMLERFNTANDVDQHTLRLRVVRSRR
jgi:hypothetical protein